MKKHVLMVLVIAGIMAFALTGCGSSNSSSEPSSNNNSETVSSNTTESFSESETEPVSETETEFSSGIVGEALSEEDLNIEDFAWEVKQKVVDGTRCYVMTLENNSEYSLLGAEIDYVMKEDISDDELKLFDDFKKEHEDYYDEGENFTLVGQKEMYVAPGEKIKNIGLAIGIENLSWYDIPSKAQFKVMEPSVLSLVVIGNDGKIYVCYYDLINEEWSVEESSIELNNWPDDENGKAVPKPESDLFVVSTDEDYMFYFKVYNASEDDFKTYADAVKKAGFKKDDISGDTYYNADDKKGNSISVSYYDNQKMMEVTYYPSDDE